MNIAIDQTTARIVRFVATAATAGVVVLASAAAAGAQIDPGVNYDPESPAGKEYAIPLVLGRAEGAGTEDQRAAANTPFGVGITPAAGRSGGQGGNGGAASGGESPAKGEPAGSPETVGGMIAEERRGAIARAEEPAAADMWTLGIWLAVLLPALALALVLRGGRAQTAS